MIDWTLISLLCTPALFLVCLLLLFWYWKHALSCAREELARVSRVEPQRQPRPVPLKRAKKLVQPRPSLCLVDPANRVWADTQAAVPLVQIFQDTLPICTPVAVSRSE